MPVIFKYKDASKKADGTYLLRVVVWELFEQFEIVLSERTSSFPGRRSYSPNLQDLKIPHLLKSHEIHTLEICLQFIFFYFLYLYTNPANPYARPIQKGIRDRSRIREDHDEREHQHRCFFQDWIDEVWIILWNQTLCQGFQAKWDVFGQIRGHGR